LEEMRFPTPEWRGTGCCATVSETPVNERNDPFTENRPTQRNFKNKRADGSVCPTRGEFATLPKHLVNNQRTALEFQKKRQRPGLKIIPGGMK